MPDKRMMTPSVERIFEKCDGSSSGSGQRRAKIMRLSNIEGHENGLEEQMQKRSEGDQSEKYQEGCAAHEDVIEKMQCDC